MTIFYSWLTAGLLLALSEIWIPGFVIIFFGAGAVLTAFVSLAFPGISPSTQAVLFIALSLASLAVFRRQAVGSGAKKSADASRDYDDDFIGREAVVVEDIPADGYGKVELNGVNWSAKSREAIALGARVKICARDGLTLEVTH